METTDADRLAALAGRLLGKLEHTVRRCPVLPAGERIALAARGDARSLALAGFTGLKEDRL
jgi:hypothetical protein